MDNAPELIQSAEAAAILGEPQTTFNRKAAAGDYPVVTKLAGPTGARLFDKATIVAIAESRIEAAATRIRAASYDSDRGVPNGTPHQDTTQQEASDDSDPIEGDAADHGDGLLGHDEDETADEDASDMSERVATTPVDDGSTVTASATRSTFAEGVTDSTSAPEPVAPSVHARPDQHERSTMSAGKPARILWNRRPTGRDVGCIDEIVLTGVDMVHVEQMDDRCWWIGITLADGTSWDGNFTADSKGRMRFFEQESSIEWALDASHEEDER